MTKAPQIASSGSIDDARDVRDVLALYVVSRDLGMGATQAETFAIQSIANRRKSRL